MRPEMAKYELGMLTGDQAAQEQEAHLTRVALLQEAQQRTPQDAPAQVTDKTIPAAKPQEGPQSPLDRMGNALEAFMKNGGKLTPELKKEFEGAIADTDKGPSPAIPELTKKAADLQDEIKKLFPPEKQQEAKDLQTGLEADMKKLPDDKRQQLMLLMQIMGQAENKDDAQKIVDKMKQVAPDVVDKMEKLDKLMGPVLEKTGEYQATSMALAMEQKDAIVTRILYAQVCLHSGDQATAAKYIKQAADKDQDLLKDPQFAALAAAAGLDVKNLKKTEI